MQSCLWLRFLSLNIEVRNRFQNPSVFSVDNQIQEPSENRASLVFKWQICVRLSNGLVFEWWSENLTEKACLWYKMSGIFMVRQLKRFYHLNTGHP